MTTTTTNERGAVASLGSLWTAPMSSPKTAKSFAVDAVSTLVQYWSPAESSGAGNVCPHSTPGCVAGCLGWVGRAGILVGGATTNPIREARRARTRAFFDDRVGYVARMVRDAQRFIERTAGVVALRPNGTSDIAWEHVAPSLFGLGVPVYDYTKSPTRALRAATRRANWPSNYSLTYSVNERCSADMVRVYLASGIACAIVCDAPTAAAMLAAGRWNGFPAIDGDATDARFLDRQRHGIPERCGYVVVLRAKGTLAKRDVSGFVWRSVDGPTACGGGQ